MRVNLFIKCPRHFNTATLFSKVVKIDRLNTHCYSNKLIIYCNSATYISFDYVNNMYEISKLNHYNTNSLDLIPGLTAIRFHDGLAATAHQCHIHVPQTFNMRCVIPFHPSIRNCCTCRSSYIGKSPSPNHPTDEIPITLNWIEVKRFG